MRYLGLLTLLALASMSGAEGADPARGAQEIAVLVSPGASAYREASLGAAEALRADFGERVLEAVELDGPESIARAERLLAARPSLVIAVGSRAAKLAHVKAPDIPLVYAMVLEPASVGLPSPGESPKQATTGVSMDVSPDEQFELLQQVVPQARRVGVLYDPAISGHTVRAAAAAAKARGLVLVAQSVRDEGEVMAAAALLVPQVDALWAVADPTVLTPTNARSLILLSLRSRKPLFAMSEGYVRSGALAALSANPREVGRRAGELAKKALQGSSLRDLRAEAPPIPLSLFVNRATAERLGVALPAAVVERARTVFPEQTR